MQNSIKNLFTGACFFIFFQSHGMERVAFEKLIFKPQKSCSDNERCALYKHLESYLNSSNGKRYILCPKNRTLEFPSKHTYFLHLAIALYDRDMVEHLLKQYGTKIIAGIEYGCETMNFALQCNDIVIIQLLKRYGAEYIKLANGNSFCVSQTKISKETVPLLVTMIQNREALEESFDDPCIWN